MTIQDLSNNRDRIVRKIKFQITLATNEEIKAVMNKMLAMLPQFEDDKPTMKNIDNITMKATFSYIKFSKKFTTAQAEAVDAAIALKRKESLPSSLR